MTSQKKHGTRIALLFVIAFALTNIVNSAVTLAYQSIVRLPSADEVGLSWLQDPAYQATVPWHALIAFVIFACTALWLHRDSNPWKVGAIWAATAMIIDAIVYVGILGSTRWGLPAADFYLGNQPWITLTYIGLLVGPWCAQLAKRSVPRPAIS